MARKIAEDGFVLSQAYKRLGELTDESSDRFNQEIFDQVRQTAYGASQWLKEGEKSSEEIWEATKSYFAIGFTGGIFVGIDDTEVHNDLNLGNYAPILETALGVFNRVRYCNKPSPDWFKENKHLFEDLETCVSREVPESI